MTQEDEIVHLKKQLSELVEGLSKAEARESQLLADVSALQADNQTLQEQLAVAQKRIEELEKQQTPPAFVKANVKKPKAEEKQPRKKRDGQYNRARRRETPTVVVEHRIKALSGVRECIGWDQCGASAPGD